MTKCYHMPAMRTTCAAGGLDLEMLLSQGKVMFSNVAATEFEHHAGMMFVNFPLTSLLFYLQYNPLSTNHTFMAARITH